MAVGVSLATECVGFKTEVVSPFSSSSHISNFRNISQTWYSSLPSLLLAPPTPTTVFGQILISFCPIAIPLTWYPYFQAFSFAELWVKFKKKKNCPQISREKGHTVKKVIWGKLAHYIEKIEIGSPPNTTRESGFWMAWGSKCRR